MHNIAMTSKRGRITGADLAQLRTEGAHLGGALSRVAWALGICQHVEAARQHIPVALQLRFRELQGQTRFPLWAHWQPQFLLASGERPLLQQLLCQISL